LCSRGMKHIKHCWLGHLSSHFTMNLGSNLQK
jgi:hypothetical protein